MAPDVWVCPHCQFACEVPGSMTPETRAAVHVAHCGAAHTVGTPHRLAVRVGEACPVCGVLDEPAIARWGALVAAGRVP